LKVTAAHETNTVMSSGARSAADREAEDVHVLYIAGMGRSGSTLLCRTLGSMEGFVGTGELMRIIDRGVATGDLCSCGTAVNHCGIWSDVLKDLQRRCPGLDLARLEHTRKRITEGWEFLRYLFLPAALSGFERDLNDYREFLAALYRSVHTVTGARLVVDASKNLLFAKLLTETPGVTVSILHLIRDSRGVAHSWARKTQRPGTHARQEYFRQLGPVLSSVLWSTAQLTAEWLGERAERSVRVRYEDFVAAPSITVNGILDGLGSPRRTHDTAHVDGTSVRLGIDHLVASNPNRSLRGVIELREDLAWRRDMPPVHQWLVTGLTLPLLRRYGYRIRPQGEMQASEVSRIVARSLDR
jgi:hypothetical protein